MMRPDAGQTVGLQLATDGDSVIPGSPAPADLAQAEEVLHVMTDLVRDHVRLREIAGRTETVTQRAEEAEIEVELLVLRTVERSDGGAGGPTRGLDGAGVQDELRFAILRAQVAEDGAPCVLGVGEDDRHEVTQRVLPRGGRTLGARLRCLRGIGREDAAGIEAEEQRQEQDDDRSEAAAHDRHAQAAHAAAILDVVAPTTHLPAHGDPPGRAGVANEGPPTVYTDVSSSATSATRRIEGTEIDQH